MSDAGSSDSDSEAESSLATAGESHASSAALYAERLANDRKRLIELTTRIIGIVRAEPVSRDIFGLRYGATLREATSDRRGAESFWEFAKITTSVDRTNNFERTDRHGRPRPVKVSLSIDFVNTPYKIMGVKCMDWYGVFDAIQNVWSVSREHPYLGC